MIYCKNYNLILWLLSVKRPGAKIYFVAQDGKVELCCSEMFRQDEGRNAKCKAGWGRRSTCKLSHLTWLEHICTTFIKWWIFVSSLWDTFLARMSDLLTHLQ